MSVVFNSWQKLASPVGGYPCVAVFRYALHTYDIVTSSCCTYIPGGGNIYLSEVSALINSDHRLASPVGGYQCVTVFRYAIHT